MAEFEPEIKVIDKDVRGLTGHYEIGQDFGFFGAIVVDDNDQKVTICSSTKPLPNGVLRNCENCFKYLECKAGKKHMQRVRSLGYKIQA